MQKIATLTREKSQINYYYSFTGSKEEKKSRSFTLFTVPRGRERLDVAAAFVKIGENEIRITSKEINLPTTHGYGVKVLAAGPGTAATHAAIHAWTCK